MPCPTVPKPYSTYAETSEIMCIPRLYLLFVVPGVPTPLPNTPPHYLTPSRIHIDFVKALSKEEREAILADMEEEKKKKMQDSHCRISPTRNGDTEPCCYVSCSMDIRDAYTTKTA